VSGYISTKDIGGKSRVAHLIISRKSSVRICSSFFLPQIASLILSDTLGDDICQIAAGPTVHDPVTAHQGYQIFKRLNILDKVSVAFLIFFEFVCIFITTDFVIRQ
jgi:glycerate-2-kinase